MEKKSGTLNIEKKQCKRKKEPEKVINQYETEEFMEFCRIMRDWYNKGYVRKDGATVTDTSPDRKACKFIAEYTTG